MAERDAVEMRVRVRFPERENVLSPWLSVLTRGAGANQDEWLPDEGELVAVLLAGDETTGCVLGSRYTRDSPPAVQDPDVRSVTFSDGSRVSYDRVNHVMTIQLESGSMNLQLDSIQIGGGASPLALASLVGDALTALKSAISSAGPVPNDGGAGLKATLLAGLASWPPALGSEVVSSD